MTTAESLVMSWEDVLSSVPARGAELKSYEGKVIELRELRDETRGTKNPRQVLVGTARFNGQSSSVTIPDRDAKLLKALPRIPDVLYARIELDGKGTPRLTPARQPEAEDESDEPA